MVRLYTVDGYDMKMCMKLQVKMHFNNSLEGFKKNY